MGIKEKMLEKIEKNSIKINVRGENIYLKKSGYPKDWHVIYPPVNPETGKWDLINLIFGGKANAIKYSVIGIIVLLLALGVNDIVHSYNITFSNPLVQECLKTAGITLG